MSKSTARTLGGHVTAAVVGVVTTAILMGGGLALAQEAPSAGTGVAETLAAPNTVNGAAVVNGSLGRADLKVGSIPLWARVRSDGTLIAGKGVVGTSAIIGNAGAYQIDFSRDITACAWIATATDNDASSAAPGFVTVERRLSNDVDSLEVRTYDVNGSQAAPASGDGFAVLVNC